METVQTMTRLCVHVCQDNSLVVGGGDNNIHVLDLEHGLFKVCDVAELFLFYRNSKRHVTGAVSAGGPSGPHGLRALRVHEGAGGGASVRQRGRSCEDVG